MIVTSPPYWNQRDNGPETETVWEEGDICQLGQEKNPQDFIEHLVEIFDGEGRRCLRPDGQLWVNLGETFSRGISGLIWGEAKQKLLIPYRFAIAMQERGWVLRSELIWAKGVSFADGSTKGGGMPSAVHDRLNHCHEPFFGFVKPRKERKPYYASHEDGIVRMNRKSDMKMKRYDYFSDMNPIRLKAIWVDEDGDRTDFYGRKMASSKNAGGSPKQHSVSQPNLYMTNHPLGKNPGSIWQINTNQGSLIGDVRVHSSPYPTMLIEKLILFSTPILRCSKCNLPQVEILNRETKELVQANCNCIDEELLPTIVLDPFMGSGTTAIAALESGRDYIGFEMNSQYVEESDIRISDHQQNVHKSIKSAEEGAM
jgi:DNA modification methylase